MFNKWLNRLRNIIGKLNHERYERTGDVEYRKDVRDVVPRNFGKNTDYNHVCIAIISSSWLN